jgi:hypothetical protein
VTLSATNVADETRGSTDGERWAYKPVDIGRQKKVG